MYSQPVVYYTLENEIEPFGRPQVIEIGAYPMEKLTDRVFEQLVSTIYEMSPETELTEAPYDRVELMRGVGEKGRDVVLWRADAVIGVVQCKHSINPAEKVDQPTVGRELIKLLLHSFKDASIVGSGVTFAWHIATNGGFTEGARELANAPHQFFANDLAKLRQWTGEVITKNKKIELVYDEKLEAALLGALSRVRSRPMDGSDLSGLIERKRDVIAAQFFRLRTVVDADVTAKILELGNRIAERFPADPPLLEVIRNYLGVIHCDSSMIQSVVFDSRSVQLKQIYEPLKLIREANKEDITILNRFPVELLSRDRRILITNTAGMGKSTIAKFLALKAVEDSEAVPVLIKLRRLSSSHTIEDEVIHQVAPLEGMQPQPLLRMIASGGFLFLLDGYDEIAESHRTAVVQQVLDFVRKASENAFVLSSRPDADLVNFGDFSRFNVAELKMDDAISLIRRYGSVAYKDQAERLVQEILAQQEEGIVRFLANPMLAALLYRTYVYRPSLAHKRSEFYDLVYRALFDEHDMFKEGFRRRKRSALPVDEFEKIVRVLAWQGAVRRNVTYKASDIMSELSTAVKFCGTSVNPSDVLQDLLQSVPLLVRDGDFISWTHKSLQDYFAARFIQALSGEKQERVLRKFYEQAEQMAGVAEVAVLFNDLEPVVFRHTLLFWLLCDLETHVNKMLLEHDISGVEVDDVKFRAAALFETQDWWVCVCSKSFLTALDAEWGTAIAQMYEFFEKHAASLRDKGRLVSGLAVAAIVGRGFFIFNSRRHKTNLVFSKVLTRRRNPELHDSLFAPPNFVSVSPGGMVVDTLYTSSGQMVGADGSVGEIVWTLELYRDVTRLLSFGLGPVIFDAAVKLRMQLEAEMSEREKSAVDVLEDF